MAKTVDRCIADSEFNKRDLRGFGYDQPIDVIPIMLDLNEYRVNFDPRLLSELEDRKGTKILFVGRIAPNKRYEDILRAFYVYKKRYDSDAELNLVGPFDENDGYYRSLIEYVEELGISDVHFRGSIPFTQINSYYKGSNVLLCQSEHEGFCVPLVEAMIHALPIIGYDCCAVGETMGTGTLAVSTKDPEIVAALIDKLQHDDALKSTVLDNQAIRLEEFESSVVRTKLEAVIRAMVDWAQ